MLQAYARYCRAQGMRPSTIELRLGWLSRVARDVDLASATTTELVDWLAFHDWKPETRRAARAALRSFYQWLHVTDQRIDNPSDRLPVVKVPTTLPRPTPSDVLREALRVADDRQRLMISLAAFAGLRRSEIAGLRWMDVSGRVLRIEGKGGRVRHVPISPALADVLDAEAAARDAGSCGTGFGRTNQPMSPYVFPGVVPGQHAHPDTIGLNLARCLGGGWSGHTLRHRFATLAYRAQRDLLTVQRLLGHSKPETTARYAEPPAEAALAAVMGAAA